MSRSRKHTPITGITSAHSEKDDKIEAHRRERRCVRVILDTAPDTEVLPHTRELSNVWCWAKDGKIYAKAWLYPRELRK